MVLNIALSFAALCLLCVGTSAEAFVLLSGTQEARLAATEAAPEVNFLLPSTPPKITGKDRFADGAFENLSDEDFWLMLVEAAMQRWNDVEGAFITFTAKIDDEATLNSLDQFHSIVVSATNETSSAYAQPEVVDGVIADCDIAVSTRSAAATSLAFTLMHELGHCAGLGHNHSDYKAAMGYSRSDTSLKLGLDDEAGLIFLYPDATVPAPQELIHCGTISAKNGGSRGGFAWIFALPLGLAWLLRPRKVRV